MCEASSVCGMYCEFLFFFFQAEDGIRDIGVTGVQTCALPIYREIFLFSRHRNLQKSAIFFLSDPLKTKKVHGSISAMPVHGICILWADYRAIAQFFSFPAHRNLQKSPIFLLSDPLKTKKVQGSISAMPVHGICIFWAD